MKFDNEKFTVILAEKQVNLKDLCEEAGVGVTTLQRIRKGVTVPRPATVGKIAKALDVDVKDIIQGGDSYERMER